MLSKPKPNKKRKLPEKSRTNQLTLDRFSVKGKSPAKSQPSTAAQEEMSHGIDRMDEDGQEFSQNLSEASSSSARLFAILPINYKIIRHDSTPSSLATEETFKANMSVLQKLAQSVLSDTEPDVGYVTATRMCENICVYNSEEELYNQIVSVLQSFTVGLYDNLYNTPENADDFLQALNVEWKSYCSHLNILSVVFCQLDRGYILTKSSDKSLTLLGKKIFRETILSPVMFRKRVLNAIRKVISTERVEETSDEVKTLLQELLEMLADLSYYSSDFEPLFLEDTNAYYKNEASKQFNILAPPYYINYAQKCLDDESSSKMSYLTPDTKKKSAEVIVKQLVLVHTQKLIDMGFDAMMEADMTDPLSSMYGMLRPYSELTLLRTAFEKYVKSEGEKMIKYPDEDPTMIQSLIEFKGSLDNIFSTCFKGDANFLNGLKESFEYFINTRGNKPAELLSKFIDGKIKSSSRQSDDSHTENTALLNSSLDLFRFIHAKDAFEAYYKRSLSKRLLLNRSISIEMESEILGKLKAECGEDYTKNLESMINDIRVSSEMATDFMNNNKDVVNFSMSVNVISQEVWPTYVNTNLALPQNMNVILQRYDDFYKKKFSGRSLTWQKNSSSCVLRANFAKGPINIHSSLVHTAVLLLFNDKASMSIGDIEQATGLERSELGRILLSLSSGKACVLNNLPDGIYSYNPDFKSQSNNLRISLAPAEQTVAEERDVEINIAKDRQYQIDAAIVRLMKNKKTMFHADLMTAIYQELKFPIEGNDIKKRVESLIDKGYIARDASDGSLYNYLN